MDPDFRRIPSQTARLYIYPRDSEHPRFILITAPIEVRQTVSAEEVVHLAESGEEEIFEVPYGWSQLNISRAAKSDQFPESPEEEESGLPECGCPNGYCCEECAPEISEPSAADVMEEGVTAFEGEFPCTGDPEGKVASGNECSRYPACGCEVVGGDGGTGDPPDFSA